MKLSPILLASLLATISGTATSRRLGDKETFEREMKALEHEELEHEVEVNQEPIVGGTEATMEEPHPVEHRRLSSVLMKVGWTSYQNDWDEFYSSKFANGGSLCGFGSKHRNKSEDRTFRFNFCVPVDGSRRQMTITAASDWNPWRASINFNCPDGSFISQVSSLHENRYEDRKFQFICHKYDNYDVSQVCGVTGPQNNFDGEFNYDAPNGYVITGVTSGFSSNHKDRNFSFKICRVN